MVCLWALAGSARGQVGLTPVDEEKARLAGQIDDPAEATRAYLDAVPAERREKTKVYACGNYILNAVDFLLGAVVLIGLLALRVSARMRDRAERLTRFRPLRSTAYWVQFLLLVTVISFPLTFYRSYHREKAYGLLTQALPDWMLDQLKGLAIGAVLGSLFLMVLYGVLRRAERSWWIWGSAVMVGFLIVGVVISPVFIAPIFNKFTPVKDPQIREMVLTMARQHQIPADEVYEVDASRRTERISAYVSGLLGTMRIVLNDTTLRRCTPAEVKMIMGHEMGHYVLDHIWKSVGFSSLLVLLAFVVVKWGFSRATARWPSMEVSGVSDLAGFPLLWLLLSSFLALSGPLSNTWGRTIETEADDFGLMASREPDAAATTFLKLGEYRDLDPHPLIELLFYDHPSGRVRIRNAMEWKKAHREAGAR
jgi:STE24 endopeptidase